MQILSLLSIVPLQERMIALADLMGEKLRPAYYTPAGDAGAIQQNVILAPNSNEGPYVITGWKHDAAAQVPDIDLTVNGSTYIRRSATGGVRTSALPAQLNVPIVVNEANTARVTFVANTPGFGTIRMFFAGFHCTPRFARTLREWGELWADQLTITSTDGPMQLPPAERNTLLELVTAPAQPTAAQLTSLNIRVHDVILTPTDLTGVAFATNVSFGRDATMDTSSITGRVPIRIPRSGVITARMAATAGTLRLNFLGRRVWVG